MPSTKDDRKKIYSECYSKSSLSLARWAMFMGVGNMSGERDVSKKLRDSEEKSSRGVSMPEALSAQLLNFLEDEGYNLMDVAFDDTGRMIGKPSKMNKKGQP